MRRQCAIDMSGDRIWNLAECTRTFFFPYSLFIWNWWRQSRKQINITFSEFIPHSAFKVSLRRPYWKTTVDRYVRTICPCYHCTVLLLFVRRFIQCNE